MKITFDLNEGLKNSPWQEFKNIESYKAYRDFEEKMSAQKAASGEKFIKTIFADPVQFPCIMVANIAFDPSANTTVYQPVYIYSYTEEEDHPAVMKYVLATTEGLNLLPVDWVKSLKWTDVATDGCYKVTATESSVFAEKIMSRFRTYNQVAYTWKADDTLNIALTIRSPIKIINAAGDQLPPTEEFRMTTNVSSFNEYLAVSNRALSNGSKCEISNIIAKQFF